MTQLPIRKLTLYKQGIGYYERRGEIDGALATVVVPRHAVNDALKSLTVTVRQGGHVLGVDYETPADRRKVLEELAIRLGNKASLVNLLVCLCGCQVTLYLEDEAEVSGRVIGVDTSLDAQVNPASVVLQTGDNAGQVQIFPLSQLHGFSLHDERATTDIGFFLDVHQMEQARATVTVRLSEDKNDLEISYLAPIPTWRVSYRLIGQGENKAQLIGWGLFDNQLDEDLDQVDLTLISGRPITFEYGLYESYTPSRPFVSDDPMAIEAVSDDPTIVQSLSNISHELRTPLNSIIGFSRVLLQGIDGPLSEEQTTDIKAIHNSGQHMLEMINNLLELVRLREGGKSSGRITSVYGAGPLGDLKASSAYFKPVVVGQAVAESFKYQVEMPVSVRRGYSAMVPIISETVDYEPLCVYSGNKMPNHPLLVWRLRNATGKVLEQGAVTLVDGDQYLGEGIMHFTGVGDEIQIPYALEYGIQVRETTEHSKTQLLGIKFDKEKRQAKVSRYSIIHYQYQLTSHLQQQTTVFIERRDPSTGEYFEMPLSDFAAAGHTRWAVVVDANAKASFTIRVRNIHERYQDINEWKSDFVNEIQAQGLVSDINGTRLEKIMHEKSQAATAANQVKNLESNYEQVVGRQEQLRLNLGALGNSKREAGIRNSVLDDLETSENQRRNLEQQIADLKEQIAKHRRIQRSLVQEIFTN
ncbi:MAG: hypothetical protein GY832_01575 [Chloroflexi bacterium]|nr:hypothetical protein [Chloroflexota bacterium]